jgi:hypothetical protein
MNKVYRTLGFLWLLPMTIVVWTLYVLPLWITGQIMFDGALDFLVAKFVLIDRGNWYSRVWSKWGGWSGPCVIIYNGAISLDVKRIWRHELRHCMQQFVFGPTHYPLYGAIFLAYWAFTAKDPYYDNPFEVDARKHELA